MLFMENKSISIDSSDYMGNLCKLGSIHPTDKSPYNKENNLHKHPYSAVYDLLFAQLKNKEITLGEIGILDNNSMKCWREFFPFANLIGMEYNKDLINKAKLDNIENCNYIDLNVQNQESLDIIKNNYKFDILIDDSTHIFEDQVNIILTLSSCINNGGIFVIEDIFKNIKTSLFLERIKPVSHIFSYIGFINCEHKLKYSGSWNNDRLLIMIK